MAAITTKAAVLADNAAYHLVRRAQAKIAGYQHFSDGDLAQYQERDSFETVATRLADHYFNKSKELQIHTQVVDIYTVLLIMAPMLQRLPLSYKYDWHRGHLLSFVRTNTSSRVGRYHCAIREVKRSFQPELLAANLEALGIHDAAMVEVLLDLYRKHCGGTALKERLAHQLFDPILLSSEKQGYELRIGNQLIRLEKQSFDGSVDMRHASVTLLDYSLHLVTHKGGYGLEILISDLCISEFREHINRIMNAAASPEFKHVSVKNRINDFVERTRSAHSAKNQVLELKRWLSNRVRKLAGTSQEAKMLPELLVNLWLQRVDHTLYLKSPSFFFNPRQHDEKTFTSFFSPYREG